MTRDIAPLTRALDDATFGTQNDVYGVLAAWNQSIDTVLNRGDGSRFREVMGQYLEDVLDLVDAAATNDSIDWGFLHDCVDAYPPGVGDHHCSSVLANVVARDVIRTRIRDDVDTIPTWALEYLADVTMEDDSEWAWESAGAFGWAIGHSEVSVLDRTLERAEDGDESWAMNVLTHVTFAEPAAGIDLIERLLQSPGVIEDLVFIRCLEPPFELNFPDFPQYWEPQAELDYVMEITDDLNERLHAVLGESIDPARLRQFDDSYRFDLQRAADEYDPANDE